ncbi:WD40 repeat domain-containing protein [Urbifossiella limnaea]|uniref:WD40 repeat domain-containing protein n=1 Tax=Urbifossiella limnaea TaxID=2528023 RepID=A0A517Y2R7_9BACT|nr:hypothetical protein [Urbifossiella limnaea]QDU23988.1 hypothetical protein ETAA1_59990 [Urbifossiella limnaea]
MPVVVCPGCGARMTAHDAAVGKSVKCPECQTAVPVGAAEPADEFPPWRRGPVDDNEPDDRPRRRGKSRPKKSGALVALIAGLLAVAVLAGGGFAAYWFGFRDKPDVPAPAAPAAPAAATTPETPEAPEPPSNPGDSPPARTTKTPVPDGWMVYDVPGCGFRVALPAPPSEEAYRAREAADASATGRMFRSPYGGFADSPSKVLCAVGRVTPPATVPADRRRREGVEAFRSDFDFRNRPGAKVLRRAAPVGLKYQGKEVVAETSSGDRKWGWVVRSAVVGDDVFVMAVSKENELPPAAIVDGFFDSLEVTGGADWANKPAPKPAGTILPTKTVAYQETLHPMLKTVSLSADGGTVGVFGLGKFGVGKNGPGLAPMTAFYDVDSGKRVGVPILQFEGHGPIAAGGKTTVYDNTSAVFVHDIATGQKTEAATFGRSPGRYSFAPSGRLLVTAQKSTLRFQPWPAGAASVPEVDAGSPVYGLSQVFQGGTRVAAVQYDADDVVARVWDVTAGRAVKTVPLKRPRKTGDDPGEPVLVAEDGKSMVVRTEKDAQAVWDLSTGERMTWWDNLWGRLPSTRLKPMTGGRILYAVQGRKRLPEGGGWRDIRHVVIADHRTGGVIHDLEYPPEVTDFALVTVECTPDGRRVASQCPVMRKVYVWDVPE